MNALEITLGLSISLSGKFQLQGQQALQGFLLWQSYINAQGGIPIRAGEKRAVRLIWYDDRSRINGARENVVQLLRTDHGVRHFSLHGFVKQNSAIEQTLLRDSPPRMRGCGEATQVR